LRSTAAAFRQDKMRQRRVPSPDEWDAVALTFAEPVASDAGFAQVAFRMRGRRPRRSARDAED
jgi:hypothetical protein